jgi:uncharacterized protein (DUF1015 family)
MAEKPTFYFEIKSLSITNSATDPDQIERIAQQLRQGETRIDQLPPILVRIEPVQGYFIADGNNRVEAAKKAGCNRILGIGYTLGRPVRTLET